MKKWYKAHKAVDPLVLVVTVAEHTLLGSTGAETTSYQFWCC